MNYEELLNMQEQLDQHIMKKQKLQFIKLSSIALPLSVEISEVANSYPVWKHWKSNKEPKPNLLEEVADVLSFLLQASNRFKVTAKMIQSTRATKRNDIEDQFLDLQYITFQIKNYGQAKDKQEYVKLFWSYFKGLWEHLGFSEKQIYEAYLKINKINYERQATNY